MFEGGIPASGGGGGGGGGLPASTMGTSSAGLFGSRLAGVDLAVEVRVLGAVVDAAAVGVGVERIGLGRAHVARRACSGRRSVSVAGRRAVLAELGAVVEAVVVAVRIERVDRAVAVGVLAGLGSSPSITPSSSVSASFGIRCRCRSRRRPTGRRRRRREHLSMPASHTAHVRRSDRTSARRRCSRVVRGTARTCAGRRQSQRGAVIGHCASFLHSPIGISVGGEPGPSALPSVSVVDDGRAALAGGGDAALVRDRALGVLVDLHAEHDRARLVDLDRSARGRAGAVPTRTVSVRVAVVVVGFVVAGSWRSSCPCRRPR